MSLKIIIAMKSFLTQVYGRKEGCNPFSASHVIGLYLKKTLLGKGLSTYIISMTVYSFSLQ